LARNARDAVREKKAVLFDLFHTLTSLETVPAAAEMRSTREILCVSREAWNEQLLERSHDRLIGRKTDEFQIIAEMARAIDPSIDDETIRRAAENRAARFAAALKGIAGETVEVLRALRATGKKLALVSNADVSEAAAWDKSPIAPLFDAVVFSCKVGYAKPERKIYEIALERLSVEPREAVFVGDGGSDELGGAKSVGIATVMMTGVVKRLWPGKIKARLPSADFVIENLNELVPRAP
jgi:putative hydrolase of the HAD superfamily